MTPLVFGFGAAFGVAAWRMVPPMPAQPRGAFVVIVLLAILGAYLAGRRRRSAPVTATAVAVAVSTSVATNEVHVHLAPQGPSVLDQLDTVAWRQGPALRAGTAIVDAELAELGDDAADELEPAELLELSAGDRERLSRSSWPD